MATAPQIAARKSIVIEIVPLRPEQKRAHKRGIMRLKGETKEFLGQRNLSSNSLIEIEAGLAYVEDRLLNLVIILSH